MENREEYSYWSKRGVCFGGFLLSGRIHYSVVFDNNKLTINSSKNEHKEFKGSEINCIESNNYAGWYTVAMTIIIAAAGFWCMNLYLSNKEDQILAYAIGLLALSALWYFVIGNSKKVTIFSKSYQRIDMYLNKRDSDTVIYKVNQLIANKPKEENKEKQLGSVSNTSVPNPVNASSTTTVSDNLSPTDEIRKYKQLLDDGIITQEDYDLKKKQLLGL